LLHCGLLDCHECTHTPCQLLSGFKIAKYKIYEK
jgi:hypothetical protein